jgi:hypothetical protein
LLSSSAIKGRRPSDDELTTASRQGEKTTASHHETRLSRTHDRAWNWNTGIDRASVAVSYKVHCEKLPGGVLLKAGGRESGTISYREINRTRLGIASAASTRSTSNTVFKEARAVHVKAAGRLWVRPSRSESGRDARMTHPLRISSLAMSLLRGHRRRRWAMRLGTAAIMIRRLSGPTSRP